MLLELRELGNMLVLEAGEKLPRPITREGWQALKTVLGLTPVGENVLSSGNLINLDEGDEVLFIDTMVDVMVSAKDCAEIQISNGFIDAMDALGWFLDGDGRYIQHGPSAVKLFINHEQPIEEPDPDVPAIYEMVEFRYW